MQSAVHPLPLPSEAEWIELHEEFESDQHPHRHVKGAFDTFKQVGAKYALLEDAYIDRDFSAAHSKFYSSLFQPGLKYCERLHFFREPLAHDALTRDAAARRNYLLSQQPNYLGFVVIRPLPHAPVSWCVVSANHFDNPAARIPIVGRYWCHILGAELYVDGAPATEQDRRVGACAQAAAWTIARHTHVRHRGPWYSVPAITDLAIASVDHLVSRGLPAGSDALSLDGMLRALRAMGRHPLVIGPKTLEPRIEWGTAPRDVIWQYLDSQIPVIIGLRRGKGIGHAVVAVGVHQGRSSDASQKMTRLSAEAEHFLVQDDQGGPYQPFPLVAPQVRSSGKSADTKPPEIPWSLDDCQYLVVPMPDKVFLTGDDAELVARDLLIEMIADRDRILERRSLPSAAPFSAEFLKFAMGGNLIARTYLTHGWSYQSRAVQNQGFPANLKEEITRIHMPRFVWVTEFFLPSVRSANRLPDDAVVAHVVIDATGSPLWDSVIVVDIPGAAIVWTFDPEDPVRSATGISLSTGRVLGYAPKRSGNVI